MHGISEQSEAREVAHFVRCVPSAKSDCAIAERACQGPLDTGDESERANHELCSPAYRDLKPIPAPTVGVIDGKQSKYELKCTWLCLPEH